jgi:hypothetical protein
MMDLIFLLLVLKACILYHLQAAAHPMLKSEPVCPKCALLYLISTTPFLLLAAGNDKIV